MGDMNVPNDDIGTAGLDPYQEYRKYLFKYHEVHERLKELDSIKRENENLRRETSQLKHQVQDLEELRADNLQLSQQVRNLEMDKRAAHSAAEVESKMLREELRRSKKGKTRKGKKSDVKLELSQIALPPPAPSSPIRVEEVKQKLHTPDNRAVKRKLMATISETEDPEITAKRARQKRTPKISLSNERQKAQNSVLSTRKPVSRLLSPPKTATPRITAPVVVSAVLPPPQPANIDSICEEYNWIKDAIPTHEYSRLMKEMRLSKNALSKKFDKAILEHEERSQSAALDSMLALSDDDDDEEPTPQTPQSHSTNILLLPSPSKTPTKSVTEDSNDYNPDMLDAIFSQVKEACFENTDYTMTPAPVSRPIKEVQPEQASTVVAMDFDSLLSQASKNVPDDDANMKPTFSTAAKDPAPIQKEPEDDDVFSTQLKKVIAENVESVDENTTDTVPPALNNAEIVLNSSEFSDDEDATLCIADETEDASPAPPTPAPLLGVVGRQESFGFSALDTPTPKSTDNEFNKVWSTDIKKTTPIEYESIEQLEKTIKDCYTSRTEPFFVRQFDDIYLVALHSTYDLIVQSIPDNALTYSLKVKELDHIDEIFAKLYQLVRAELRGFKKARQDVKSFRRIEAMFVIFSLLLKALPQNGAEVNGRLTDFIVFVAENINARINEAVSFCSLCLIVHTFFPQFFKTKSLAARILCIAPYFTIINYCHHAKIFFNEDCFYPPAEYDTAETSSGKEYKIFKAEKIERENYSIFSACFSMGKYVTLGLDQHEQFVYGNAVLTIQCAINGREWCKLNVEKLFETQFGKFTSLVGASKGFTEKEAKELIHSLQIFGVSLRTQVGTKDSETKKALKGFSRILPGMFKVSDDVSPLQLAIANHALLVFVHLKDVTSCRDVVRTEFARISDERTVPEVIEAYVTEGNC